MAEGMGRRPFHRITRRNVLKGFAGTAALASLKSDTISDMRESAPTPERSRSPEEVGEFRTPFCNVTLKEFVKSYPEQREALRTVLKEIDTQAIENFDVFHSKEFPDVSFSYSRLTVTPEIVKKLATQNSPDTVPAPTDAETDEKVEGKEEGLNAKRHDYFLFAALVLPPDGHAFTAQDLAIDRYIRLMSRVAAALSRGETPPEVNVYLLGAPTGLGGSVTPEWKKKLEENGFEEYGKLYAEFIKQHEPSDPAQGKEPHIVLQGASKGAIVAEKTSHYLPEKLLAHTQRLLDNPIGDHTDQPRVIRWLKGAQIAPGFAIEFMHHKSSDIMKGLMAQGGVFIKYLSKEKGIPEDGKEQASLKRWTAAAEVLAFIKGTPLDTEKTRSFIRRGISDPVTYSSQREHEVREKIEGGTRIPFFQRGRSVEVPFKGRHMFIYDRYHRWSTILDFAKNWKNIKPEDWKLKRGQSQ